MAAGFIGFMAVSMMLSQNPELQQRAQETARFMQANPWQVRVCPLRPPSDNGPACAAQGALLHNCLSVLITTSGIPFALVDLAAGAVHPGADTFGGQGAQVPPGLAILATPR